MEENEVAMGADSAVAETAARSLCIKRFATNAESHARCLSGQLAVSRCIAMLVLEVKKKLEIIGAGIDSRKRITIATSRISAMIIMD